MKISVDRLCELAGVKAGKGGMLTEASNRSMHDDPSVSDDADWRYGKNQLAEVDKDEGKDLDLKDQDKDPDKDLDELIEIDEVELVQELRRAKKLMNESRLSRRRQVSEHAELKNIIEEEVANVMSDFNLTSQWVYGNRKPTFSRKGRITTSMPGIGFGKKW
jgi:hypothetical protein